MTGTRLLWVSNTESDVFRLGKDGPVYFLVSGRWFTAPGFTGPWTFATPTLPEDFKKIPLSHERSRVLASVPGTDEAAEAVLLAQIPQTARVNKKTGEGARGGRTRAQPQFQPIEKTTVSRAVNTDKDIIKVGDLYYMCFQGVWFMGESPNGPWEVDRIGARARSTRFRSARRRYNVTNVTVVEDNNDAVVFATAAAYTGMMIAWGCAVWGTGYYYPPYVGYGGFYPVLLPVLPDLRLPRVVQPVDRRLQPRRRRRTVRTAAPASARATTRGPARTRAARRPTVRTARAASPTAYNPRTGAVGATRQGSSVYGSWGQTGVQRGDQWAITSRVTNNATGDDDARHAGQRRRRRRHAQHAGAGRRRRRANRQRRRLRRPRRQRLQEDEGGGWQKYDNGGWNNVSRRRSSANKPQQRATQAQRAGGHPRRRDAATIGQLNRDSAARAEGAQRTSDCSNSGRYGVQQLPSVRRQACHAAAVDAGASP